MKEYLIEYGHTLDTLEGYRTDDKDFAHEHYLEHLHEYPICMMSVRDVSEWEEV